MQLSRILLSRNVPHTTYSNKGEASLWSYIFIQPDELLKGVYSDSSPYAEVFADMLQNFQLILNKEDYPEIYFIIRTAMDELQNKRINYQLSVKGLMLSLFMKVMRVYSENKGKKLDDKDAHENAIVISPALDYIKENYMMNFPMEELADL